MLSGFKKISELKLIRLILVKAKRASLPGFEKVPIYDVVQFFIKGLKDGAVDMRAASLAYYFFMALFPLVLFLFTLIPYIPIVDFQNQLFDTMKNLIPANAFHEIQDTINEIISNPNGGLLSFGFIATLYFSTNGFSAMIDTFNASIHINDKRTFIQKKLIALVLLILTTVTLFTAITLIIFSEHVMIYLFGNKKEFAYYVVYGLQWAVILFLLFTSLSFNYYFGPGKKHKWPFFSAGSTLATIISIISSLGFSFYINNFGNYNKLYGSIGTLIVVMLWIYINCFILLLGFELNASIHSAKNDKKK